MWPYLAPPTLLVLLLCRTQYFMSHTCFCMSLVNNLTWHKSWPQWWVHCTEGQGFTLSGTQNFCIAHALKLLASWIKSLNNFSLLRANWCSHAVQLHVQVYLWILGKENPFSLATAVWLEDKCFVLLLSAVSLEFSITIRWQMKHCWNISRQIFDLKNLRFECVQVLVLLLLFLTTKKSCNTSDIN